MNKNYRKGYRKERELVNNYRRLNWISARSAGSHGPFDVFAWNPNKKEVHFIQVKTNGKMVYQTIYDLQTFTGCKVIIWKEVYK